MPAPKDVLALVEKFDRHRESYESAAYNETQLRREFLDPMFDALGWDVQNRQGVAEAYKDVIHEDAIKVGEFTKAPDYAFRIGGTRKFFVEAKKPAKQLKDDAEAAFQLRRYAWSAKLPLSILTDFQEFAVYDTRLKPSPKDKASVGRVLYFTHAEYAEKWEEIAAIFSRDAVLKGAFDKFAEAKRPKRGTAAVDEAFLEEIEGWREALAKNIAVRNHKLDVREINFAVQRIIDRIIFLRIAEDRGIEPYGRLQGLLNGKNVYARLVELFEHADDRYNSGLFHFKEEKGRAERPDELTPRLKVDDDALQTIIGDLYLPKSPYAFSVIPADILGAVYEQFLGKVIRLTAGHHVKVEEKPEVRKAGGVYYTPTYIVDYIVKQTVGKLLEGKTPKQAAELKVLDPACGSGSFLIGAYQHLLDWHRDWYVKDGVEKQRKVVYQGQGGAWWLTTKERTRILLNNIYGVDIDQQAVEVTKLSLLLKVLEGGSPDALQREFWAAHERVLPDLGANIKCGNSLIGSEFYAEEQLNLLSDEERYRINAFDWKAAYPSVFAGDDEGFDAVVGNPPYIRVQALNEWAPIEVEFYKRQYKSASKGNYDIYVTFVERGIQLLSTRGTLGFILPHKFFNTDYGEPLRRMLGEGQHVRAIVHFRDLQIFSGSTTYTCLLFLTRQPNSTSEFRQVQDLHTWRGFGAATVATVPASKFGAQEWYFPVGEGARVYERLRASPITLGAVAHIYQGLVTGADDVFVVRHEAFQGDALVVCQDAEGVKQTLERALLKPFIKDVSLSSFADPVPQHWIVFPYRVLSGKATLLTAAELARRYPRTWGYLKEYERVLRSRERGKWNTRAWHAFGRTQNLAVMDDPKLIVQVVSQRGRFAFDESGIHFTGGGNGPYYGIRWADRGKDYSIQYLQGLLNSRALDFCLHQMSSTFRGGYWSYGKKYIEKLPMRMVELGSTIGRKMHDQVVDHVTHARRLAAAVANASTPREREVNERHLSAVITEIDQLVYELYGLTDEEIRIVEEATAGAAAKD